MKCMRGISRAPGVVRWAALGGVRWPALAFWRDRGGDARTTVSRWRLQSASLCVGVSGRIFCRDEM